VTRGEKRHPINCAPACIETSLGTWHRGPLITSAVTTALSLDAACCRIASRLRLPFAGLSTWLLAQKP
jgi:hypothetical protein